MITRWSSSQVMSPQLLLTWNALSLVTQCWPRAFGEQQGWVPHLVDILKGPKPALALPLASALHAYKRAQAVGKEAGQDLLSTKPQVRVVPDTKGSSYKISDGKLKKTPFLPGSPPAVLRGHSQMSWHLMAVLSRALPKSDPQPWGQLSSTCGVSAMPWLQQGWGFWREEGPNPPDFCRGTAFLAPLYMLQGKGPQCCPIYGQQHPKTPFWLPLFFSKANFEPSFRTEDKIWKIPQEKGKLRWWFWP